MISHSCRLQDNYKIDIQSRQGLNMGSRKPNKMEIYLIIYQLNPFTLKYNTFIQYILQKSHLYLPDVSNTYFNKITVDLSLFSSSEVVISSKVAGVVLPNQPQKSTCFVDTDCTTFQQ